ncbi:hypothetical protein LSH36_272g05070 [Paralvinella palmiformis]|uniref:Uncharacterized protein n=1 Tax=Paralvinella palmiformis TaxID=53620 RepID=A0AAD9N225_9ANNE|nr:hypothetical protein LSH36_272g05070 [Paralvinella palmiformis]
MKRARKITAVEQAAAIYVHFFLLQAVEQLLLRSEAEKIYWHQYLAEYYQYYCTDPSYTFKDLPYHMYKGGLWKQMIQYYRTDQRSIVCPPFNKQKYLNLIRCERHTPDMMNLSRPVRLCQMCALKPGLASPLSVSTKTTCIICGTWIVSHPSMETVGRVCIRHCGRFGPTSDQCFYCERLIHGAGAMSTPGLLCQHCSFGNNANRCARLLESDSGV